MNIDRRSNDQAPPEHAPEALQPPAASALASPKYKDRTVGLVLFGCVQLLVAVVLALLAAAVAWAWHTVAANSEAPMRQPSSSGLLVALAFYLALAALFVALGVGSILRRNWARLTTLVVSWLWLAFGVIAAIGAALVLPMTMKRPGISPEVAHNVIVATEGIILVAFVILPLAFVAFYSRKDVAATCTGKDVTAGRPLLISVLAILFAIAALSSLGNMAYGKLHALLGGHVLSITAARAYHLAMAIVFAFLCWGFLRRDVRAWWTALVVNAISLLLGVMNAVAVACDPAGVLDRVGAPFASPRWALYVTWIGGGVGAVLLLLVAFTGRWFGAGDAPSAIRDVE